ncbi:coiled-coil domain-containing protein 78 [Microcaecilia unicolor]|uniref:Coiled-coil domain-containing protein 78 n=1 Tax=Microcaecilia unicolor TaxID=1415580 RepID=A0A6P7YSX6_9AMPH|nr:coiled-coil domain-containing protein 78 [Microcaecilia unicolor]
MNVDIVGRIRPSRQGEREPNLYISGSGKTVSLAPGGEGLSFSFQELFDARTSRTAVFYKTLEPLLSVFTEGMNVSLMTLGGWDSKKSEMLTGDKNDRSGLVPLAIDYLFGELLTAQRLAAGESSSQKQQQQSSVTWVLSMSMYEIHREVLRDLLQSSGPAAVNLGLAYSAQDGAYIKGLSHVDVSSASEATTTFRKGWARRTGAISDYGPTASHSCTIIHFNLKVHLHNEPYPIRSWLKIVDLPGVENLSEDLTLMHLRKKPLFHKSLLTFYRVVNELAGSPYPDRVINYSGSKLTQLLEEALGGNCKTRVLCCLTPTAESRCLAVVLKTCAALSQIKNFPVLNDYCVESLATQYRARILALQHRPYDHMDIQGDNESITALKEQNQRLISENVQLQDRNERLYTKLGELQEKLGKIAGSKTDLSSKLVFNEEEKLKISKDLIDLQIETNKLREQYEAETFELKNTILTLENHNMELEFHKEKLTNEYEAARECLRAMETNRKDLADEYIVLKSNYLALSKEHEREVMKNDELSMELLNMANTRRTFQTQQDTYLQSQTLVNEATAELERVRAMVNRLSARKIKPEDVVASEHERRKLEKSLLGNQDQIKEEIEQMKKTHDVQQQKLEERVVVMGKELQEAKRAIRSTQHKIAEQSALLLTSQSQLKEVEAENSRLQLQLKELNEEYRSRLTHYIQDLAEYVDSTLNASHGSSKLPVDHAHMKRFVDSMLKDIRASHKSREEQLAGAARGYKKRMQNLIKKHEHLLISYRMQREQILSLANTEVDPGPPEHHFTITDKELQPSMSQELNQLREDKARLEAQIQELQEKKKLSESSGWGHSPQESGVSGKLSDEGWAQIRKQLREFTHNTQEELERERCQLLSRAIVAEEQLAELQEYVDKHLGRYKQEIVRLRKIIGNEMPRAFSADVSQNYVPRVSKKVTSQEF